MAYLSQIESHNDRLEALKAKVDELPEAGPGIPELTNPAGAGQVLNGYEFVDPETGEAAVGTLGADITKAAAAAQILSGYQAINAAGEIVIGTKVAGTLAVKTGSASVAAVTTSEITLSVNAKYAIAWRGTASSYSALTASINGTTGYGMISTNSTEPDISVYVKGTTLKLKNFDYSGARTIYYAVIYEV